jgi:hypothetical protein
MPIVFLKSILLSLLLAPVLIGSLEAQESSFSIPPAPLQMVYDGTRYLNPQELAQLQEITRQARVSGVKVYVAFFNFLPGENEEEVADRILQEWAGDDYAALCTMTRSGFGPMWVSSPSLMERLPMKKAMQAFSIFDRRVSPSANGINSPESSAGNAQLIQDVAQTVRIIQEGLYLAQSVDDLQSRSLARWVLGVLAAACSFVFFGIFFFIRCNGGARSAVSFDHPSFLPPVRVAFRFGGSCGGGLTSEKNF